MVHVWLAEDFPESAPRLVLQSVVQLVSRQPLTLAVENITYVMI